jgi:glycosyltransferase involved in cell wall biosynthesis
MKETGLSVIIPVYYAVGKELQINFLLKSLHEGTNLIYISEIIFVDNGGFFPSDLVDMIEKFPKAKIVRELRLGLSIARNKGIEASSGDVKAFIDDDCIVSEGWAAAILSGYENPSILCVGGPVAIKENIIHPQWFSDFFSRFIVPPAFPERSCVIQPPFYLVGANMSFRKECFENYGLFDVNLGRKKNSLLSGEEIEYMLRIPAEKIWYAENAKITTIGQLNIKRSYFIRRFFWQGVSDAIMARKHGKQSLYDIGELSLSSELMRRIVKSMGNRRYFECFCMAVRSITFNFAYIVLGCK